MSSRRFHMGSLDIIRVHNMSSDELIGTDSSSYDLTSGNGRQRKAMGGNGKQARMTSLSIIIITTTATNTITTIVL